MDLLHPHLRATLEAMLDELESSALVVETYPAPDARLKQEAERLARQRGRIGYVLHRGTSYRDSRPITNFIPVSPTPRQ